MTRPRDRCDRPEPDLDFLVRLEWYRDRGSEHERRVFTKTWNQEIERDLV
ncbi:MAG: hypothetical protein VBE63_21820 [Lamprobacter sp.]|nr:hypothetical protein [Lamprobacter sp.]MEA3642556.1 hypothetical protein [Lamprobacter sp.]